MTKTSKKVHAPDLVLMKERGERIVMLTAYDPTMARLFDKINEDVEDYVDDIAERAVQLGGIAEGTARMAAQRSSLEEYPRNTVDGRSHVDALSSALAVFGKSARLAISTADNFGDLDTADLFTAVSRGIDKWLWFVEAHQQAER